MCFKAQVTAALTSRGCAYQSAADMGCLPYCAATTPVCASLLLQDASVLAKCIEGLQSNLDLLVKEGSHWAGQAAKLGQRVQEEEQGLAEARAAWDSKLRGLDGQMAAAAVGSGAGRG